MFDYAYKRSAGYIKDRGVLKKCGNGCGTTVAVDGAQPMTDSSGNPAYLVGDKGAIGWNSQNLGVKLYADLSVESKLIIGASQFLYSSFGRNQFNTYLRDAAGNPLSNVSVKLPDGNLLKVRESQFLTGPDSDIKEYNRYALNYETKLAKRPVKT